MATKKQRVEEVELLTEYKDSKTPTLPDVITQSNDITIVNDSPVSNAVQNINKEINEISQRLYNLQNDENTNVDEDLRRLNYLQKIKNSLRLAKMNEKFDGILDAAFDRFDNDYPTFSNKEMLEYVAQMQNVMNSTRMAVNDEIDGLSPIVQNTQININTDTLDRASKERVADVVKAILNATNDQKNKGE